MEADDDRVAIQFKERINQFERADKLTFYFFIGAFIVWVVNYPLDSGWYDILLRTIIPVALVAFAASRRWSALLKIGPAAPVED